MKWTIIVAIFKFIIIISNFIITPTSAVYTGRRSPAIGGSGGGGGGGGIDRRQSSVSYNFVEHPIRTTYNLQSHPPLKGAVTATRDPPIPLAAGSIREGRVITGPTAPWEDQNDILEKFREMFQLADELGPDPLSSPDGPPPPPPPPNGEHHQGMVVDGPLFHQGNLIGPPPPSSSLTSQQSQGKKKGYHTCYRECSTDPAARMTCSFNFTVANYYTLSPHCRQCPNVTADCDRHGCVPADGRQRGIAVVNKELPGPAIRVCEGDTVVVDVVNKLVGQETTIHWHGIHQQGTPWADGVPHLTQCPIPQATTFRYQFETPKGGTYFWHSHSGVQRADGVAGAFIVRRAPESDVHYSLYDFDLAEHEIVVQDWLSSLAVNGHIMGHVTDERELPRSILVHGRGFPRGYFDDIYPYFTLQSQAKPFVPIHEARIQQGWSYRFRLISNGVTLCPIELSIENHAMLVIASDGFDVEPITVQSLVIHAGERFDFVIRGDQPVGSYWMKYRGLIDCNMTNTYQLGVLNYEGTPLGSVPPHTIASWDEAGPSAPGLQLNPNNVAPGIPGESVTIAELSSVVDTDPEIIERINPDHQFYIAFDFNGVPDVNFGIDQRKHTLKIFKEKVRQGQSDRIVHFLPQLNFITHKMPVSPPLIQPETIPEIDRCNADTKRAQGIDCRRRHCACTHWLTVELNSIVEIVLVDMGVRFDAAHPFHLHGHSFRVLGIERLGNTTDPAVIQEWDEQGLLPRRRQNAPVKDTVYVPDGGYTILRFRANNPGYWFFHCHIEFHAERGMSLIFQVGNPNEIPRAPPNFPTCGNYVPPVELLDPEQSLDNLNVHPAFRFP